MKQKKKIHKKSLCKEPYFVQRYYTKYYLLFICCLTVFITHAQSPEQKKGETYRLSGTVVEQLDNRSTTPLEAASVGVPALGIGALTNKEGQFVINNLRAGKVKLRVTYMGMVPLDLDVDLNQDVDLTVTMQKENFRLKEVVVTAVNSKSGESTASLITRNAIDHLQSTSLSDLMALLPGGITTNQNLNFAKQINIRNIPTYSTNMNAFGVSIIKDGSPLSNNANMQTMHPSIQGGTAVLSGGASPSAGLDVRLLSTDNIESVEVIRGVPSAQYGDLTSGAVIINSNAGYQPLRVSGKTNKNVTQLAVTTGLRLGEKRGVLNISGDYAHNVNKPTESYQTYQRSTLGLLYSNQFFSCLSSNSSIDFLYGADRRKLNPDDTISKRSSIGDQRGVRINTNGVLHLNKPWISNLRYVISGSYTHKKSSYAELYSSASYPYSMTVTDGAVLSNRPGVDVWDSEGRKITHFAGEDASLYATELFSSYLGQYDIEGKEINGFVKLMGALHKEIGKTNHRLTVGFDLKTDGNRGKGKTFSHTAPPYRQLQAKNAAFRQRRYQEIPFVNQIGVFAEESFSYSLGERALKINAGARYDRVAYLKGMLSPRINASLELIPKTLFLRGGYGITAKAPSVLYLYPEKAYFEYVNINELSYEWIPEEERLYITTTRLFDTQNRLLKMAHNRKEEIGFDLKIGKALLSVTAFREALRDGYTMAPTVNSFQPVVYNEYERKDEGIALVESNPVLAKFYVPTNNLQFNTKGLEFDLHTGRIDAIRTSFSLNGMWIHREHYKTDYTYFDNFSGNSGKSRTHIGMYESGMKHLHNQLFNTALRVTHNIPEIGFVVTLTAQAIWNESEWNKMGNDSIPIKYLSKEDGKVYDFDPLKKEEDEFKLLLRRVNETDYIKELEAPSYTFNINVTKEVGSNFRASFFANNMFRHYASIRSKRSPSTYNRRGYSLFFGIELAITL